MPRWGATLKIHASGLCAPDAKIELNGADITHFCQGIAIAFEAGEVTVATLKILVDELDVSAETLLMLEAHVQKAAPQGLR